MATKPLTTEAIALTEKKMDMSLDDIIKMSKTNVGKPKKQRPSNKTRTPTNEKQASALKMRQYTESRSALRQGVLAQKRSNFQGNNFPLASDAARTVVAAPFRNGGFNHGKAIYWNRPRAAGPMRRQGNASMGSNLHKQQQQRQQQQQLQRHQLQQQQRHQHQSSQRREMMPNQKRKTLDSLFANMKEQRLRAFAHTNSGGAVRGSVNQPRQPWLRGRFGDYRN